MFVMQRVLLLLSTVFALYACTGTVPHKPEEEKPAAAVAAVAKQPSAEAIVATPPAALASEALPAPPVLPTVKPFPHIALLLPLQSPVFGPAADAVQQGFMAAINPKRLLLPVRVYSNFDAVSYT